MFFSPCSSHVQMAILRSGRGRNNSRSTSRSASRSTSRSTSQRSRAPRGRAAHAGRGGRGGRPRAASSRRDSGRSDETPGVAKLRQIVLELREQLENREGTIQQMQRERDDERARQESEDPNGPDDIDADADAVEPEVIVTDMAPPPPRAPRTSAATQDQIEQFLMKERIRSWRNPDHAKRWFLTASAPVAASLTRSAMKAMMHDTVDVSTSVLGMLNDLGGFDVREFMAPEDDHYATDRMLTEQLEILIHAVVKILSKGVSSVTGQARIAILHQDLQSGLRTLRQHSIECRSQMRILANASLMADFINKDLNLWAAQLGDAASDFTSLIHAPPSADEFPPVVVPQWTRLSQYIQAGGLRNAQHQRAKSVPPGMGRGKSTSKTPSGKKGYCFAWASEEGCRRSARDCRWEHAHDPNPRGRSKGGARRQDAHAGGSSAGGSSGGGSGSASRRDAEDRGSGRGGGGDGGGGGSRSSTSSHN